jgi:protein SCO1/2
MTRRQWLTTMGLSVLAGGLGSVATHELGPLAGGKRRWDHEVARSAIQRKHLPNVPLVTHEGDHVHFYDDLVRDKKVLINFMDTHNLASALVTANLAVLQRLLRTRVGGGGDIFMYSITLRPQRDSPEVLKAWAQLHGARTGWLFLTGKPADIERLRRALGFEYADPAEERDMSSIVSLLKHGNEPEMRWAHCPSQANPRQLALMIVADFGADPALPRRPQWYCSIATVPPLT